METPKVPELLAQCAKQGLSIVEFETTYFISRETVLAHGGTLTLDSQVGKGTTVVISLPGQRAAATTAV